MKSRLTFFIFIIFILGLMPFNFLNAASVATRLKGRILLQVESIGEAWYVNPDNEKRYYLGRPDDAFQVMRNLGLGILNKDFDSFNGKSPSRLSGKILLKVEDSGKAYYVNPIDLKLNYLGRPADAFQIMRKLGLGITNNDLNKIIENGKTEISNSKLLSNQEIIKKVKPAIVYVETLYGSGSGMIFGKDGYILTNAHVVKETGVIKVILNDGRVFLVDSVASDEDTDVAILKINATNLPIVEFTNSDLTQQGDEVFTFGFPFGIKGDVSFKEGTVSRRFTDNGSSYIETSAEIHPGNSGGPLINKFGNVVGINTGKLGESINGIILGESIKFAIPINVASNLVPWLKSQIQSSLRFTSDCAIQKARGFVTIYNFYDKPQILVASTRLSSSSGLIFRIDENIIVPPVKSVNNADIPGEIRVSMTADKIGSEYKIEPGKFYIPGLFEGLQDRIYGITTQQTICN